MHAEKWGPAATAFFALCLLEVGPVVDLLRSLGLGVLLDEVILLPLLGAALALSLWALANDRVYHRERGPGRLTWLAAALALAGHWLFAPLLWAAIVALAAAAVWNQVLVGRLSERRRRAREAGRKV